MDGYSELIVGILALLILYKVWGKDKTAEKKNLLEDEMSARLAKGQEDYQEIGQSLGQLRDKELVALGRELQKKSHTIIAYLQGNRHCLPSARHFVDYYQDRTATLLKQCVILEQTGIKSQEAAAVIAETKETLRDFAPAYDNQLAKIMDAQLTDMAAELKVARQVLDGDGIEKGAGPRPAVEEEKPPAESSNGLPSWLTPKNVGTAVITVLGAVGLYKLFGKDGKK